MPRVPSRNAGPFTSTELRIWAVAMFTRRPKAYGANVEAGSSRGSMRAYPVVTKSSRPLRTSNTAPPGTGPLPLSQYPGTTPRNGTTGVIVHHAEADPSERRATGVRASHDDATV